jgi:putative membrane protein
VAGDSAGSAGAAGDLEVGEHPEDGKKMKSLTQQFLSESDREKIQKAVRSAESQTSGEIVPMVVSYSYHYPMANVLGAVSFSLPLSILTTYLLGHIFWLGSQNMWIFMGVFGILFICFHALIKRTPFLKRIFVATVEMEEEVQEAAVVAFYKEGLYRTREETGILIFISVFERKVWVLADRGIHARVPHESWDKIVEHIVQGIKQRRQADAICEAVGIGGRLLAEHFPVRPDDTDELENLIVEK